MWGDGNDPEPPVLGNGEIGGMWGGGKVTGGGDEMWDVRVTTHEKWGG